MGYQPSTLEHKKFKYSPLGKSFIKGLNKDFQEEGLFKRLKNIEGENKKLLDEINDQKIKKSSKVFNAKKSLFYDASCDFGKYRASKFLKTLSIESKFDEFEPFYKMFLSLKNLDVKKENIGKTV